MGRIKVLLMEETDLFVGLGGGFKASCCYGWKIVGSSAKVESTGSAQPGLLAPWVACDLVLSFPEKESSK